MPPLTVHRGELTDTASDGRCEHCTAPRKYEKERCGDGDAPVGLRRQSLGVRVSCQIVRWVLKYCHGGIKRPGYRHKPRHRYGHEPGQGASRTGVDTVQHLVGTLERQACCRGPWASARPSKVVLPPSSEQKPASCLAMSSMLSLLRGFDPHPSRSRDAAEVHGRIGHTSSRCRATDH